MEQQTTPQPKKTLKEAMEAARLEARRLAPPIGVAQYLCQLRLGTVFGNPETEKHVATPRTQNQREQHNT